jgi:hypothetical protein
MSMEEHNAIMENENNSTSVNPMVYIAVGISLLAFLIAAISILRGRKE